MINPTRKIVTINVREMAHLQGSGDDVVRHDIRVGKLEHIIVGKKNIRITAVAAEQRLGLNPGDIDPIITEYREKKRSDRTGED
jgi:hypothetical protein